MKRFLSAVCFCSLLLLAGLYFLSPRSEAANNVLNDLLNLPSPPPPNPLMRDQSTIHLDQFYDEYNPPRDDAPLEDLIDYWRRQSADHQQFGYNAKPSPAVMAQLIKVCEEDPARLVDFINAFPPNAAVAEKVKYFYDEELDHKKLGEDWQRQARNWLTDHSTYFLDRLVKKARAVHEDREYVTNQDDLLNLAQVDWDSAEPIIDKLVNDSGQPVSATLAAWCLYRYALEKNEATDIEKYREQLKAVVEDKSAGAGKRDLAFDALMREGDFEGRDEWYLTLMKDETLGHLRVNGQNYTGLTTLMLYSPASKYKDRMLELLKSDNIAVRTAAIRNLNELVQGKDPDVVKALLPWLSNRKWATEVQGERTAIVTALRDLQIPESVPGLISMLNEKAELERSGTSANSISANSADYAMNTAVANRIMSNAMSYGDSASYPYREPAIYALSMQKDLRAVPALRGVLPQVNNYQRSEVIKAIWYSGGFSIPEQLSAVETVIRSVDQSPPREVAMAMNVAAYGSDRFSAGPFHAGMIPLLLGTMLSNEFTVSDELVMATINRIEALQKSEPRIAIALRAALDHWHGPAMNIFALRELRKGTANIDIVIRILGQRKELREKLPGEVAELRNANPFARAIAACIIDDPDDYKNIISTADAATRTALFGCARLVRAELPLQKAEEDLKSADKALALAAERYLESEDSPAARQILIRHFPNAMKILGARMAFRPSAVVPEFNEGDMDELFMSVGVPGLENPGYVPLEESSWDKQEKKLKQEFADDKDLLGTYYYEGNYIQIYADRVIFRSEEDEARYRERPLKKEEFETFTSLLRNQNVDASPPFLSSCEYCEESELVMLGRAGGRRVFFRSEEDAAVVKQLDAIFDTMRSSPGKLHYRMEKHLPGLEILFEDEKLAAQAIWKNSDDLRLLIDNVAAREKAEAEIRRYYERDNDEGGEVPEIVAVDGANVGVRAASNSAMEHYDNLAKDILRWRKFAGGALGDFVAAPPGMDTPSNIDATPPGERLASGLWKSRLGDAVFVGTFSGLLKITQGGSTKIKDGRYMNAIVTPNGRWLVVTKYIEYTPQIVRINLQTNKEFPVNLPDGAQREAKVFIPSLNRVLIINSSNYYYSETDAADEAGGSGDGGEDLPAGVNDSHRFLLDPETGALIEIRNEVGPLEQQSYRQLQPVAGKPDTFWAAMPDPKKKNTRFGMYNAKTLLFTSLQTIPEIQFDSMDAWVDETEGKIYFVYKGQLLRLPLPTPKPAAPGVR